MERNYKSLQELTILDGFMFGAVMTDKSICLELLLSGMTYDKLPESYVIFIMNYDPFHQGKYRYSTRIQDRIRQIKGSREMGERYMHLQELLREEREEARKEGREEGRKEGRIEGREEGRLEGKSEGQEIAITNIIKKGLISFEQGAAELGITVEELREKMAEKISVSPE